MLENLPVISATNIPVMIYQAGESGIVSQFSTLVEKLQQHDNPVFTQFTPAVMSLFYQKQAKEYLKKGAKSLPPQIHNMLILLEKHEVPSEVMSMKPAQWFKSGIDIYNRSNGKYPLRRQRCDPLRRS